MAEIRKITLLTETGGDTGSYQIGDKLVDKNGAVTVESLYLQTLGFDENNGVMVVRVYVVERGSPFVDVPLHAISRIFYS